MTAAYPPASARRTVGPATGHSKQTVRAKVKRFDHNGLRREIISLQDGEGRWDWLQKVRTYYKSDKCESSKLIKSSASIPERDHLVVSHLCCPNTGLTAIHDIADRAMQNHTGQRDEVPAQHMFFLGSGTGTFQTENQ